jgi:hypothetical protein
MCYSANDSLTAYIINFFSSILLFYFSKKLEYKVISLFLLFVGQMQMFDYLFWKNQKCNTINKLATILAIIFNHLQPIVLFLLQYYYGITQNMFALIIIILYIIFSVNYNIEAFSKVKCTLQENNMMDWKWNELNYSFIYYSLFLGYLILAAFNFKNNNIKILFALISIITFLVATKTPFLNYSIGRIWCYYASLIPVFILLIMNFI